MNACTYLSAAAEGALLTVALTGCCFLLLFMNNIHKATDQPTLRLRRLGGIIMAGSSLDIVMWMVLNALDLHSDTLHLLFGTFDLMLFGCMNALGYVLSTGQYPTRRGWTKFGCAYGTFLVLAFALPQCQKWLYVGMAHFVLVKMVYSIFVRRREHRALNERMKEEYADLEHRQIINYTRVMAPGVLMMSLFCLRFIYLPESAVVAITYNVACAVALQSIINAVAQQKLDALDRILHTPTETADGRSTVTRLAESHYSDIERKLAELEAQEFYIDPDLDRTKLCQMIGTNRSYLCAYLREERHQTFYDYINQLRIEKSVELLQAGNLSVKEVAIRSGFNSGSVYSRIFKQRFGVSPTEYKPAPRNP